MEALKIIGYIIGGIVILVCLINLLVMCREANKPFNDKDRNPTDKL